MRTTVILLLSLLATAALAQGLSTASGLTYITIDGQTAYNPEMSLPKGLVRVDGVLVGGGAQFVDIRCQDGRTVRCDFPWGRRGGQWQVVGNVDRRGHIQSVDVTVHYEL
jgi:hypothetical protein